MKTPRRREPRGPARVLLNVVEKEPEAAQWVKDINGGKQVTPTVDILGEILTEPDENELGNALRSTGRRPS